MVTSKNEQTNVLDMEDKEFDKLFREAFIEAEETPSDSVWSNIEDKLNNAENIVPIKKRTNWWTMAAAIALFFGVSTYFLKNTFIDKPTIKLASQKTEVNPSREEPKLIAKNGNDTDNIIVDNPITKIEGTKSMVLIGMDTDKQGNSSIKEKVDIGILEESTLVANLELDKQTSNLPVIRQVTEIDDIKPFIEFEEETETMLASTQKPSKEGGNIITSLLNTLTDNIDQKVKKDVRFQADEEGSFSISILNSIAKNPNRKKK